VRNTLLCTLLISTLGCGSSDEPTGNDGTTGGDGASDTCLSYHRGDACIDDTNLAACQAAEAQCPGQVLVAESCPLQFSCPPSGDSSGATDCPYTAGDSCITEENLAQCQEMARQCPGEVMALESCPLQFACP
jgi:hypothetical protein